MFDDIEKILLDKESLQKINSRLGTEISSHYSHKNLLIVGLLKGCVVFLSDLIRNINIFCEFDFIAVSSYSGTESRGEIKINMDLDIPMHNKDVLIVDDILDTGITMSNIKKLLNAKNPKSLNVCVLLDKPARRKISIEAEFVGTKIENYFAVGYGLDFNEKYRNLPYIGVLKPEVVQNLR
ncbi:MAG: hypoxanthine phosphoribosyltransferase [Firmicutes bacterium]|nr:hypoxanthine phosphoribosyltransferase [Bacillota bacterium]